jgi:hypothetical protein
VRLVKRIHCVAWCRLICEAMRGDWVIILIEEGEADRETESGRPGVAAGWIRS